MTDDLDRQAGKLMREIWASDPLLVALGRALAPAVNARLAEIRRQPTAKPEPEDYCPGCGELSVSAPDLCDECLAVNNE